MNDIIKVNYNTDQPTVSARELHEFLEVKTAYKDWFPRMCEYGFAKGRDFNLLKNEQVRFEGNREVKRTVDDAEITIDMAKELCMLQRNERGKQARQYFLQLERDWNSPEKVMARALQIAEKKINSLSERIEQDAPESPVRRQCDRFAHLYSGPTTSQSSFARTAWTSAATACSRGCASTAIWFAAREPTTICRPSAAWNSVCSRSRKPLSPMRTVTPASTARPRSPERVRCTS